MKTLKPENASRSKASAWECPWDPAIAGCASQAGAAPDSFAQSLLRPSNPISAFQRLSVSAFSLRRLLTALLLISAFSFPNFSFSPRLPLISAFQRLSVSAFSLRRLLTALLLISAFSFPNFSFSQPAPIAAGPASPQTTRTESAPAAAPLPRSGNYVLNQSDVIAIRVFHEPDLDSQCRISKDGTINFPLLGLVNIAGKTANDAAAHIAALLDKDYIVRPQVSVSVVAYVKQRYSVLGQVGAPGGYNIPEEQSLDLLSAIAAAGGFTRLADQSKVIVKRQENGAPQTYKLDARAYAKKGAAKPFIILPNDTIIVEERFF